MNNYKGTSKNLVRHKGLKMCKKCRVFYKRSELKSHSMHGLLCDLCAKNMGLPI